jgi:PTH1 family peptidyl-tRNA hydrolase
LWLVVGLGNPGSRYSRTRHNIGFLVVEEFAGRLGLEFKEKADYRICSGSIEGERIALMEPLTYMNKSGAAVRKVSYRSSVPPERIIVVHDDLDLETGRLKIRRSGSSGGHKGIESVIQCIGSGDFTRVKIGIGRDPLIPVEKFVLSKFGKEEQRAVKEAVDRAVEAIPFIIADGIEKAMNKYNRN